MKFIKKSVVLKEVEKGYSVGTKPLSGIARLEWENDVLDFYLTLVGVLPVFGGEYVVGILCPDNSLFLFHLGERPSSFHKTIDFFIPSNGFSVGLVVVKNDLPLTVAFAKDESSSHSLTEFKKAMAENCILQRKSRLKEDLSTPDRKQELNTFNKQDSQATEREILYNDEAVATENYFDFDDIKSKLDVIKEHDFANSQPENELSFKKCQEEKEQGTHIIDDAKNETNLDFGAQTESTLPYYATVQTEINSVLKKFPAEEKLNKLFHEGEFVKVNYSKEKYYVVGLIKEDGKEKYLCYGVPGEYSPNPPKELAGYCSFIPLSIFDLGKEGYWMMFQDAKSGRCISKTFAE